MNQNESQEDRPVSSSEPSTRAPTENVFGAVVRGKERDESGSGRRREVGVGEAGAEVQVQEDPTIASNQLDLPVPTNALSHRSDNQKLVLGAATREKQVDTDVDDNNHSTLSIIEEAQDSRNGESNKNTKTGAVMERRTSKRQRISASHRFEPGEGGGLASKKAKMSNGGSAATGSNCEDAKKNHAISAANSSCKNTAFGTQKIKYGPGNLACEKPRRNSCSTRDSSPQEQTDAAYRWIDEGMRNEATPSMVEHQGLEIDFTNKTGWAAPLPFVVSPGDVVLMSSGEAQRDDTKQGDSEGSYQCHSKREHVPNGEDSASKEGGFSADDSFIGFVEKLWEEPDEGYKKLSGQRKKKAKSAKSARSSKMMIRTRWFFKKQDLEGLQGNFSIEGGPNGANAKEKALAAMAAQDLVLTDRSDDNCVSSIVGKVKVVKREPSNQPEAVESPNIKTTFVCRYDLSFGLNAMVKLTPCHGGTDNSQMGNVVANVKPLQWKDADSSDPASTDEDGGAFAKQDGDNDYAVPYSPLSFPLTSPMRVVSEGATTLGKIKIGPEHQATIPPQLDLERKTSFRGLAHPPSQRIPMMVWDPSCCTDAAVDGFLEEACSLLSNHMKLIELKPFHDVNYVEAPNAHAEDKQPREISIDQLLTELHECKGDVRKAVKRISGNPEKYMTIWNQKDKEHFDTSYRTYRESIRMIASSLGSSKSCKDTVDYQYRFKLVENFRRFKMKKREKAEEIMATVEDRMLNEKMKEEAKCQEETETDASSSEEEDGKVSNLIDDTTGSKLPGVPATRVGPVNNRVRTWFRTGGGGEDSVGATQQRRNRACDLLSQVMERVGGDAYTTLVRSLKACNTSQARNSSLMDLKSNAEEILQSHPDLLERFNDFLPRDIRSY